MMKLPVKMFLGGLATGVAGTTAICRASKREEKKPFEAAIQSPKEDPNLGRINLPFKNSTTSKTWHQEENPMIENASWFSPTEPKKAEHEPTPEKKKKRTEDNENSGCVFHAGTSDVAQKVADPPKESSEPEKTGWFTGMFPQSDKEAEDKTSAKKTEDNKDSGSIFHLGKSDKAQKDADLAKEPSGSEKRSWWTGWWNGHSKEDPEIKPFVQKPEKEQDPEKPGWFTGMFPQSDKEAEDKTSAKKTEDNKDSGSIFHLGKSDRTQKEADPTKESSLLSGWLNKDSKEDPELKPCAQKPEKEQDKPVWFTGMFPHSDEEAKDKTSSKKTEDDTDKEFLIGLYHVQRNGSTSKDLKKKGFTKVQVLDDEDIKQK
jgi:hypothetical protein